MDSFADLTREELDRFESLAAGLRADGYNGAVACRKMISEHGMEEAAAVQLVSRVYGKRVNPRSGDTTHTVIASLVAMVFFVLVGLALLPLVLYNVWVLKAAWAMFALGGAAFTRAVVAVVNRDVKEDLRVRKRDE